MSTFMTSHVSLFKGVHDTKVLETLPLGDVLQRIQDGTYRERVTTVRRLKQTKNAGAYKNSKATLVSFTPCCALRTRSKRVPWDKKLITTTGLVHFDFDHLEDPEALKRRLATNPALVFAFVSPGGDGLKIGVAVQGIQDTASYKRPWERVLRRLKKTYPDLHINEDAHVRFLHALCFVSHDPDLYTNPDAVPLDIPHRPAVGAG